MHLPAIMAWFLLLSKQQKLQLASGFLREVCSAGNLLVAAWHTWLLHVLARPSSAESFSSPAGMISELCLVQTSLLWHKGLLAEAVMLLYTV